MSSPQSLQWLRRRPCEHIAEPPQSLQWYLSRACGHIDEPPHSLQWLFRRSERWVAFFQPTITIEADCPSIAAGLPPNLAAHMNVSPKFPVALPFGDTWRQSLSRQPLAHPPRRIFFVSFANGEPARPCAHIAEPPQSLHWYFSRPCGHIDAPPHSLQWYLYRPCGHMTDPPHSLQCAERGTVGAIWACRRRERRGGAGMGMAEGQPWAAWLMVPGWCLVGSVSGPVPPRLA